MRATPLDVGGPRRLVKNSRRTGALSVVGGRHGVEQRIDRNPATLFGVIVVTPFFYLGVSVEGTAVRLCSQIYCFSLGLGAGVGIMKSRNVSRDGR